MSMAAWPPQQSESTVNFPGWRYNLRSALSLGRCSTSLPSGLNSCWPSTRCHTVSSSHFCCSELGVLMWGWGPVHLGGRSSAAMVHLWLLSHTAPVWGGSPFPLSVLLTSLHVASSVFLGFSGWLLLITCKSGLVLGTSGCHFQLLCSHLGILHYSYNPVKCVF